jgi:V/A-type H+-transporting ATPase subunit I
LSGGKGREVWILLTWLGLCTTVWGALTGTWFAVDYHALPPFLQALVPTLFNTALLGEDVVRNNVTALSFTLGFFQLGLASLWNLVKTAASNPLKAVSHLGWFGLTLGLYVLVLSMVAKATLLPQFFPEPVLGLLFELTPAGPVLPPWALPTIVGSYLLILLFSFQEGKFWRGLGEGVANFLPTSLNAISAFADNISYIRLFAVGLAGFYIEVSFASMASGFGTDTVGGVIATVLVLVFGHSLNLVMGFLSVIVHGIRLNVLEFSNRLGMEWSGRPYDPFRVKS